MSVLLASLVLLLPEHSLLVLDTSGYDPAVGHLFLVEVFALHRQTVQVEQPHVVAVVIRNALPIQLDVLRRLNLLELLADHLVEGGENFSSEFFSAHLVFELIESFSQSRAYGGLSVDSHLGHSRVLVGDCMINECE